ncbi:ornithine cyclodeaminase family protein [Thalassotalea sp. M1531]|uniref:Ornithine cyclodeaminase family protein n=1 Tax=Thalassotalea algicola TaxID=2716224 RepID=A0A7Y0Q7U6_9GAMM|nr:ornithine cyclodeaminase family protein [Thalassotalea algicola]NMP33469.1 ornithine cyclodeaminase family protein [Thalassotalea algicola]
MNNFISAEQINQRLTPRALVDKLAKAFASDITTPMRQHFDIDNPYSERETTLLVMPSWQQGKDIGIKLVTVVPDSYKYDLPSIQGVYVLLDAVKGNVKAILDAPTLTAKRTAAASALASQFMSRADSKVLTMVGTGTLAPELIKAHAVTRPITTVNIWGRNLSKAQALADALTHLALKINVVESLEVAVSEADIISCATMSQTPLIKGHWLKQGQHLDMVGAYRPDMREADDECIRRSRIVVDNYQGACKETGDIRIPLDKGILTKDGIVADLFELCKKQKEFVRRSGDITFFKSVGHALEDLAAAQLVYECQGESK